MGPTTTASQCWSNWDLLKIASTSIDFDCKNRGISGVNLKHLKYKRNCFNKIRKMLKQIRINQNNYNNWKKLGDKTGVFGGVFEAIWFFNWFLQHRLRIHRLQPSDSEWSIQEKMIIIISILFHTPHIKQVSLGFPVFYKGSEGDTIRLHK